jgi:hypothetical protein
MILDDIEIIEPYPAVFIEAIDALIISDLHLGYEGIMAEQGIFMPKVQFKKEMNALGEILEKRRASNFIIVGDIKHEFSDTTYHEFREVREIFKFLKEKFGRVVLIKGNHDNYIIYTTRKYDIELYDELLIGDFLFVHGDRPIKDERGKYIVMGHEHPAIALFDEIGVKEKLNCFLYGKIGRKKLLVMPAFSYLAQGSEVNMIPRSELLSPILREADIDKMRVIAVSEDIGCLDFGELGKIRPERLF